MLKVRESCNIEVPCGSLQLGDYCVYGNSVHRVVAISKRGLWHLLLDGYDDDGNPVHAKDSETICLPEAVKKQYTKWVHASEVYKFQ